MQTIIVPWLARRHIFCLFSRCPEKDFYSKKACAFALFRDVYKSLKNKECLGTSCSENNKEGINFGQKDREAGLWRGNGLKATVWPCSLISLTTNRWMTQ